MKTQVRHISLKGGYNFRDLGGYKSKNGQSVKWKKVFRSDDLAGLADTDLDYLNSIPLLSIVDFRADMEVKRAPDKLPDSVKQSFNLSINPGNMDMEEMMKLSQKYSMDQLMEKMYEMLVTDSEIVGQYKKFFALLQESSNLPLLFHCSAGKDRTGIGAALFLSSLEVDEKIIMEDYLLSNPYVDIKYAELINKYPQYKDAFRVNEDYIRTAYKLILDNYKTVDYYLQDVLEVDLQKMREFYLVDGENIRNR